MAPQPFFEDRGTPIALLHVLRALRELGYEIDMLTLPVGRPLDLPGVRVLRVSNPLGVKSVPIGFSLRKVFFDLLIWRELRRLIRKERYEYIHAVEEAAIVATLSAGRRGVPVLYDMQSSLPEQLAQHTLLGRAPLQAVFKRVERWLVRSVDAVVCSAGLESYVETVWPGTRCWRWIFPSDLRSPERSEVEALRAELAIPDGAEIAVYTGSFAPYQGVGLLLEAMPRVAHERRDAFFVVVGASSTQQAEKMLAGLPPEVRERCRILPRAGKDRIPAFLGLADLLVSLRIHGGNAPLKVFDYLSVGRAIVATDIPAHRAVLDDSVAVLVQPEGAALASVITGLLGDAGRREELASAARAYARELLAWPNFVRSLSVVAAGMRESRTTARE